MATSGRQVPEVDSATVRLRLQQCYRQLVHQLLPHILIPYLVENKVLDISEAELVLAERGLLPQSSQILALLERKEDRALQGFITSLRQSKHDHLADALQMPTEAVHTDKDEVPMCADTALGSPGACSGDSSLIDIKISLHPGHHGEHVQVNVPVSPLTRGPSKVTSWLQSPSHPTQGAVATGSALVQGQSVSASTSACPDDQGQSSPTRSHGSCPSPGCRCGELQQSLFQTLWLAQQSLAEQYPLRSDQDVQKSAECRQTMSQCLEVLRWMSADGMHTQEVLQACVLLRVTCRDMEALDNLLKMVRDGSLMRKLETAFELVGNVQSVLPLFVTIHPSQYLVYRECLDISCGDLNEFRSHYPEAFRRRMGDDLDSQYYLQMVQCLLARERHRNGVNSAIELWQTSSHASAVLVDAWTVSETGHGDTTLGWVVRSLLPVVTWLLRPLTASAHFIGAAGLIDGVAAGVLDQPGTTGELTSLAESLQRHVELTQHLLFELSMYRYTAYGFAKLMFSFTEYHGLIMEKGSSLKAFGNYILRLVRCYPRDCEETLAMDHYVRWLSRDHVPRQKLMEDRAQPVTLGQLAGVVSGAYHSLQDTVDAVRQHGDLVGDQRSLLAQDLHRISDAMQNLVVECRLYDPPPQPVKIAAEHKSTQAV